MIPRRPRQRARRRRGAPGPAPEQGFYVRHASRGAALVGAELDELLASLELQRDAFRALGVSDPLELEVCVLTREPFSWTVRGRMDALREAARDGLPAAATAAEVDAAAIRLLREWAGLGHVQWPVGDEPAGGASAGAPR